MNLSEAEGEKHTLISQSPNLTAALKNPIINDSCTGKSLVFSEGILHVHKDGSGYILVDEKHWEIKSEYDDDGARTDFWITRFPASEIQALKDFLNKHI